MTPPGGGGIAVVSIRGTGAGRAVEAVFRPHSPELWASGSAGQLAYGQAVRDGDVIDEVIVRRVSLDPPRFEVNCHGGIVPAAEIIAALCDGGAREGTADEGIGRCGRKSGFDAIQAAALRLLPQAQTRLGARVLCDQLDGALSRALAEIDPAAPDASDRLAWLRKSAAFGRALLEPMSVAIVGPPNAGKSTLFNVLVGHDRMIVSPAPGTTRDFVDEHISLGGMPLRVIDTAGLRDRPDVVEAHGIAAALAAAERAQILVVVLDASVPPAADEAEMIARLAGRDPIVVANKMDLRVAREIAAEWLPVSAATGQGISELGRALLAQLPVAADFPPGSAVAFTADLEDALDELVQAEDELHRSCLLRKMLSAKDV
jgi:tRNA modification GTPase